MNLTKLLKDVNTIKGVHKHLAENKDGILSIECHPAQEQILRMLLQPGPIANIKLIISPSIKQSEIHFNYPSRTDIFTVLQ